MSINILFVTLCKQTNLKLDSFLGKANRNHSIFLFLHFLRLIVLADKTNVYRTFPIPLINRLEKHFLVTSTAMNEKQLEIERELSEWADNYSKPMLENSR